MHELVRQNADARGGFLTFMQSGCKTTRVMRSDAERPDPRHVPSRHDPSDTMKNLAEAEDSLSEEGVEELPEIGKQDGHGTVGR